MICEKPCYEEVSSSIDGSLCLPSNTIVYANKTDKRQFFLPLQYPVVLCHIKGGTYGHVYFL